MTTLLRAHFHSNLCRLWLLHDGHSLHGLRFLSATDALPEDESPLPAWLQQPLQDYSVGDIEALARIPVQVSVGTEFQRRVWSALQRIPAGSTWSYAQLAAAIGQPQAMRAVGNANGRNPIALVIPCHRVIASDGTLGGFSSGLELKRRLLAHEGVQTA